MSLLKKQSIYTVSEKPVNYTLFGCEWIPSSNRLVVVGSNPNATGSLSIMRLDETEIKVDKVSSKPSALHCCSLLDRRRVVVGDYNGSVGVYDMLDLAHPTFKVRAHQGTCYSVDTCGLVGKGAAEIVSCGQDGAVRVWDPRQPSAPVAALEPDEGVKARDCFCAAFGHAHTNTDRMFAAGYDNGDVIIYDLKAQDILAQWNVGSAVMGIEFDRKDTVMNTLAITTIDGEIFFYDLQTFNMDSGFASLKENVASCALWKIKHLPQCKEIMATSGGDGEIHLFKYQYPQERSRIDPETNQKVGVIGSFNKITQQVLSTQPVASFSFSPDFLGLFACTAFDQTLRCGVITRLDELL
ncbi:hypothetical protein PCE1_004882 [Barthelona sp. PCE]